MADIPRNFPSEASSKGAPMSEEEAEYWDDLFTRTTPKLADGKGGFFAERQQQKVLLDEKIVRYINAKSHATHQTPAEFVAGFAAWIWLFLNSLYLRIQPPPTPTSQTQFQYARQTARETCSVQLFRATTNIAMFSLAKTRQRMDAPVPAVRNTDVAPQTALEFCDSKTLRAWMPRCHCRKKLIL